MSVERSIRHDPAITEAAVEGAPQPTRQGPGDAEAIARRLKAVRLRLAGLSYEQIAREVGYADRGVARRIIHAALDKAESHEVETLRALENGRLDAVTVNATNIMIDASLSPNERMRAADTLVRASARRARLNGLDAPAVISLQPTTRAELQDALHELSELVFGEVVSVDDEPYDPPEAAVR